MKRIRPKPGGARGTAGITLTELVVGALLLSISLSVVAELMFLCVMANARMFRQFDAQASVHFALDRIKRDVRAAKEVCSVTNDIETSKLDVQKRLSPSVLILHLPVYYFAKSNDPSSTNFNATAEPSQLNGFLMPFYYTVIYEVVADPANVGDFMIVLSTLLTPEGATALNPQGNTQSVFDESSSIRPIVNKQIIARGLIGPLSKTGGIGSLPQVFSYLAKNPSQGNRLDILQETVLWDKSICAGIAGVGLDLEVKRGELDSDSENQSFDRIVSTHSEVCLRLPTTTAGRQDGNLYEQ